MPDRTINVKKGKVIIIEKEHQGLAYCPHCGTGISDYFVVGEMVLVDAGTERPYFAQISSIKNDHENDLPYAIVLRSPQESEKVLLSTLRKVF